MTVSRQLLFLTLLFSLSSTAFAQDKLVLDALATIEKYEALEPGLKSGDVATANRYLNGMGRAAKRLGGAYDKTTDHWKDASARYNALVAKIQAKAKAEPAPVTPGVTNAPTPSPAKGKDEPVPATPRGTNVPTRSPTKTQTATVDLRALEALNSRVKRAFHNMKSLRVEELDDERNVQRIAEQITEFRAQLTKYPADDQNVKEVAANVATMENVLKEGLAALEKMRAPQGTQERLDQIAAFYKNEDIKPLAEPLEPGRVLAWAEQVRRLRDEQIPADVAWLDSIRGKVGVNQQEWQRVRGWVASSWPLKIRGLLEQSAGAVYGPARSASFFADMMIKVDPEDAGDVANCILGEGALKRNVDALEKGLAAIDVAAAFDQGMSRTDAPDYRAEREKVEGALEHLRRCAVKALDQLTMPKPTSEDPALLAAAAEVLKAKEHKAGTPLRMVINFGPKHNESREGSIVRSSSTSSSITVYEYVWDEFQVTTVEKEGDNCWLYYNRFKKYEKGSPSTVTGKWILTNRFKGTQILESNIQK